MRRTLTLLSATLIACSSVSAGVVTFDNADGYTPSISLSGQPGWAGAGGMWNVQPRDGSGDNLAQSANPIGDGPFSNTRFTPDAAILDGDTSATGIVNYSFEIRNDAAASVDDFNSAHIIRLADDSGDGTAVRFNVLNNGVFQVLGGGGATDVVDAGGNRIDLDDRTGDFLLVEGAINFDNQTYTATVDGVPQQINGNTTLGFFEGNQDDFGIIRLQRGGSTSAGFRQLSLDNFAFSRIPEPTSIVLLASLIAIARPHRSRV